jgi:hypothetical protein
VTSRLGTSKIAHLFLQCMLLKQLMCTSGSKFLHVHAEQSNSEALQKSAIPLINEKYKDDMTYPPLRYSLNVTWMAHWYSGKRSPFAVLLACS